MRNWAWGLMALLCLGWPARAADREHASVRDVQQLQRELENLDDDLQALEDAQPDAAREFQRRADPIRDRATALERGLRRRGEERDDETSVSAREVDDLRRDVRRLAAELDDRLEARRSSDDRDIVVPAGAEMSVRIEQPLSSASEQPEDTFRASVDRPVRVAGRVAIPAGTELRGIVRDSQPADRLRRGGRLSLDFDALYLGDARIDLRTRVLALDDENGKEETVRKAGLGAIIGGAVGGLLKGRTGALVGVLAGGGVVMAERGEDVDIPEGTVLRVRLDRDLVVPRR
jgi:hypothetical protein